MKACEAPELKIFAELEPIKSWEICEDSPLYSTVAFPIENGKLSECEHTGLDLFKVAVRVLGESQGFLKRLSYKETNLQRGHSDGRFPSNSAFAATSVRFSIYTVQIVDGIEVESPFSLNEHEEKQILRSVDWYINNNPHEKPRELSPTFFKGPISEYNTERALKMPVVFAPEFSTNISVRVLSDLMIRSHSSIDRAKLCVSCHLDGYWLWPTTN